MKEIITDMADDYLARRLTDPHDQAKDVVFRQISGQHCEAVIRFKSGGSLTGEFDLPAAVPPSILKSMERLLWDAILVVEKAIKRDIPAHGHTVH